MTADPNKPLNQPGAKPPDPGFPDFPEAKPKQDLPSLPAFGKVKPAGIPMLRGTAGGSLGGRLRNLKAKDVAFIAAGLSVLVLAPIVEHMVSKPGDQGGTLRQGFDQKGPGSIFANESPYEPGILNKVKNPINAASQSVFLFTGKLHGLNRTRILRQRADKINDPLDILLRNRIEIFGDHGIEQVSFSEDADKFIIIQDQDTSDLGF